MRKRFIVLTTIFPIAAACPSLVASAQVPPPPAVARVPALQDSALQKTLRRAREVLANAQRVLEDTTVFAAVNRASENAAALSARLDAVANRALENAAALSVRMDAQQAVLEQQLQRTDAHLRTVFQQLERIQRRLDEVLRQQNN